MNVLASFTMAQHVAQRMLRLLLLCFPMGARSCSTQPWSPGLCWGGRGAGAQQQLLLRVWTCVRGAKGERNCKELPGPEAVVISMSLPSFPSATQFSGCCCGGKGEKEGEVFWAGNGVDWHSLGRVREGYSGCARRRKAGKGLGQVLV